MNPKQRILDIFWYLIINNWDEDVSIEFLSKLSHTVWGNHYWVGSMSKSLLFSFCWRLLPEFFKATLFTWTTNPVCCELMNDFVVCWSWRFILTKKFSFERLIVYPWSYILVDNFRVKTERTGPTKRRAGAGDPEVKLLLSKTGGGGKGGGVGGSNSDGDYQLVQHEVRTHNWNNKQSSKYPQYSGALLPPKQSVWSSGISGTRHIWSGGQVLEERNQWDCGHQDSEEPSQLRQTGTDRGLHTLQTKVSASSLVVTKNWQVSCKIL